MNANKLRYYIADRERTLSDVEAELGISKTALYRKLNGMSEFTRAEIQKLIGFLDLADNEIMEIFFARKVS